MSSPRIAPFFGHEISTPATRNRVQRCFALRTKAAAHDAFIAEAPLFNNGDEARYSDKCGTYTKGVLQSGIGIVDPAAYRSFKRALDTGNPADFAAITVGGGTHLLNGPQGGLAFDLQCLDGSQFQVDPAPALASEEYATELVELYWASLLRDVAFTDYSGNPIATQAAAELSSLPTYAGPTNAGNVVTTDLFFRGGFPGETLGPYLSQFILQNTAMGALPIVQTVHNTQSWRKLHDRSDHFSASAEWPCPLVSRFSPMCRSTCTTDAVLALTPTLTCSMRRTLLAYLCSIPY